MHSTTIKEPAAADVNYILQGAMSEKVLHLQAELMLEKPVDRFLVLT